MCQTFKIKSVSVRGRRHPVLMNSRQLRWGASQVKFLRG